MAAGHDSSCHPNVGLAWLWVQFVQGARSPSVHGGRKRAVSSFSRGDLGSFWWARSHRDPSEWDIGLSCLRPPGSQPA